MTPGLRVWVSLGSNVAERQLKIAEALQCLKALMSDMLVSDSYVTPALNGIDSDYMNAVATGVISIGVDEFSALCKDIERNLGRSPASKQRGEVEIDLDLVVCDGKIIRPSDFSREYFQRGYRQLSGL
ncbi:MAG: hypothetical protein HDS02_04645 [Bacteroides sp.]|nr:hypothetical protein [Barnesiella sp.]MBD5324111.1 hypothetical protein [Bacteroides sp.]MBD5330316.1 hypothetical protein [Bacteroides sp.]MDE7460496.1 2-amino-4-hydroxy-6-hydroxymethyldihydropteridine diphosphokinase [Paramuribaculum sp.]